MEIIFKFTKEEMSLIWYALNIAINQTTVFETARKLEEMREKLQPFSGDKC